MRVAIWGAVALLTCSSALADGEFVSGNWRGGAFYDQAGAFSHCAMSASYTDGTLFLFSVNSAYNWTMGFAHPQWQLQVGKTIPLRYYIDGGPVFSATAQVISPNQVVIDLDDTEYLFNRMRKGWTVYLQAEGSAYQFSLLGTSRALNALLACAGQYARQPAVRSATNQPATNPAASAFAPTESSRLEATTVVANILGQSGMAGYQIVPAAEIPATMAGYDVVWTGNGVVGAMRIVPGGVGLAVEDITAALVAADNKLCKGEFVSGIKSVNEPELKSAQTIFTTCRSTLGSPTVNYTVLPRSSGGHYVFALISPNSTASLDQEEAKFRTALASFQK